MEDNPTRVTSNVHQVAPGCVQAQPADANPKKDKKQEFLHTIFSTCKEIIFALLVISIIFISLTAYSARWPPIVGIESDSMMHGEDSSIGTMDTGDIVIMKSVSGLQDISTYMEGEKSNYKTYNSYGDVIGFKKNGGSGTEMIHRAVVWLKYNSSGNNGNPNLRNFGSFDIPSLGLTNVTRLTINGYEPNNLNVTLDLTIILSNFQTDNRQPHSGFLTKGDNNDQFDQFSSLTDSKGRSIEPVKLEWIEGKAEGELPWFGLLRLYLSGETSISGKEPPTTSRNMLVISIIIIIIFIIGIHLLFVRLERKRRRKKQMEEEKKLQPFKTKISKRLDTHGTSQQNSNPQHTPEEVSKSTMISYMDEIIDIDESEFNKVAKDNQRLSQNYPSSDIKITIPTSPDHTKRTIAKPYSWVEETRSSLPTEVIKLDHQPVAKPVNTPTMSLQTQGTHPEVKSKPRAKKVTEDDILGYLDSALERR